MPLDINIGRMKSFIDKHIEEVGGSVQGVPPLSSIEFSILGLCNRTCVFCPRVDTEKFPSIKEFMSFELYKKVMDELRDMNYTGRISYSGFSEPLFHKQLLDFISYSKKICPRMVVEITTNGDILTVKKLKELFAAGLTYIKVSVYDGPEAHAKFEKMREESGLSDKQVLLRARWLPPEENYGLTISNRAGSVAIKDINLGPLKEPLKQSCYYPSYKMMVDYTGEVLICSNDWAKRYIVGDLNKMTVMEVWNGPGFTAARKRLANKDRTHAPCNLCDVNGLYNGENHFAAWQKYYENQEKTAVPTS